MGADIQKYLARLSRIFGGLGLAACLIVFITRPSFPTPDKLLVVLTLAFMAYSQALAMLKRLLPFVAILLVYESFRSMAGHLNSHVNYLLMPAVDRFVFGKLPTAYLQDWLWRGRVRWIDFVFYIPYLLHFVLPLFLALLIWKKREDQYWRFVWSYLVVSYMGFITYVLFPAAPPWMAAKYYLIEPIHRISSEVWFSLGMSDFPSFYSQISPNPVAAVPSLHAAWAVLLSIFVYKLFGKGWGLVSLAYPALIFVGTVYTGEHYVFDVIIGAAYAVVAYALTPKLMNLGNRMLALIKKVLKSRLTSSTKSVAKSRQR